MKKIWIIKLIFLFIVFQDFCNTEELRQIFLGIRACTIADRHRETLADLRTKIENERVVKDASINAACDLLVQFCKLKEQQFNSYEEFQTASKQDKVCILLAKPDDALWLQKKIEEQFAVM